MRLRWEEGEEGGVDPKPSPIGRTRLGSTRLESQKSALPWQCQATPGSDISGYDSCKNILAKYAEMTKWVLPATFTSKIRNTASTRNPNHCGRGSSVYETDYQGPSTNLDAVEAGGHLAVLHLHVRGRVGEFTLDGVPSALSALKLPAGLQLKPARVLRLQRRRHHLIVGHQRHGGWTR